MFSATMHRYCSRRWHSPFKHLCFCLAVSYLCQLSHSKLTGDVTEKGFYNLPSELFLNFFFMLSGAVIGEIVCESCFYGCEKMGLRQTFCFLWG